MRLTSISASCASLRLRKTILYGLTTSALALIILLYAKAVMSDQVYQQKEAPYIDGSRLVNVSGVVNGGFRPTLPTVLQHHTPTNVAVGGVGAGNSGIYLIIARGGFAMAAGGRDVSIKINNAVKAAEANFAEVNAEGLGNVLTCSTIETVLDTDEIELEMTQNSGGPLAIVIAPEITAIQFFRLARLQ